MLKCEARRAVIRAEAELQPSLPSVKAQLHLVGICPIFFLTTVAALATSCMTGPTTFGQVTLEKKVQLSDLLYSF